MNTKLLKIAQEYIEKDTGNKESGLMVLKYLSILRGLSTIHQHAHWVTSGENSYGDHLLFDRIYNGVLEDIDSVAEKLIGVFSKDDLSLSTYSDIANQFVKAYDKGELVQRSLAAEKFALDTNKKLYNALKDNGSITLGLDDLIMSIASNHEEHVYLLKQRSL